MRRYLDQLDAASVPTDRRVLAALGPRMQGLAADRALGAYPYHASPTYLAAARARLSTGRLLALAQAVVIDDDDARGRAVGREVVDATYLRLRNYRRHFRDQGFTDSDFADGGSDRLVDAILVHGSLDAVAAGIRHRLDAGADHVALNLVTPPDADSLLGFALLADTLVR
jgi:probable F420-dependent oxidoreductase